MIFWTGILQSFNSDLTVIQQPRCQWNIPKGAFWIDIFILTIHTSNGILCLDFYDLTFLLPTILAKVFLYDLTFLFPTILAKVYHCDLTFLLPTLLAKAYAIGALWVDFLHPAIIAVRYSESPDVSVFIYTGNGIFRNQYCKLTFLFCCHSTGKWIFWMEQSISISVAVILALLHSALNISIVQSPRVEARHDSF